MSTHIVWSLTIGGTVGVWEIAKRADEDGRDIETNFVEIPLDFVPSIDYVGDFFTYGDDPETGDEKLDEVIIESVKSFGNGRLW